MNMDMNMTMRMGFDAGMNIAMSRTWTWTWTWTRTRLFLNIFVTHGWKEIEQTHLWQHCGFTISRTCKGVWSDIWNAYFQTLWFFWATMHCTNEPYLRQNCFVEIWIKFVQHSVAHIGVAKSPSQSKSQLHVGFGWNLSGAHRYIPTYSNAHFSDSNGNSVKVPFVDGRFLR